MKQENKNNNKTPEKTEREAEVKKMNSFYFWNTHFEM